MSLVYTLNLMRQDLIHAVHYNCQLQGLTVFHWQKEDATILN